MSRGRSVWMEMGTAVMGTLVCYLTRFLIPLIPVPLMVLASRRGPKAAGAAAAVSALGMGITAYFLVSGDLEALRVPLVILELAFPVLLMAGAVIMGWPRLGSRRLYRWFFACALATAAGAGLYIYVSDQDELLTLLFRQIEEVRRLFPGGNGVVESFDESVLAGLLTPDRIAAEVRNTILYSGLFFYGLCLGFAALTADRMLRNSRNGFKMDWTRFQVPDSLIWALIFSWAGVLAGLQWELGYLDSVFWNWGKLLLVPYFFQGLGILRFRLEKAEAPVPGRRLVMLLVILGILVPRVARGILIVISGLGVSEIWVKYRNFERR